MKHKEFYRSLLLLVIPITIQNFLASAVSSADVFMISCIGQDELSAVSLANQFQFILNGIFFGISSGIVILSSQYWGKKDTKAIQNIMGIAFRIAFCVCFVFAIGAIFMPSVLMSIYTDDISLIRIGSTYLRCIGISYIFMSFSQVYHSTLRSMEQATVSTIISSTALIINISLNAILIFGLFHMPKLGVVGVALATTISRGVELILCFIHIKWLKEFRFKFRNLVHRNKLLFVDFIKYSTPALLNDIFWTLAFSTYSIIMGHLNSDVVAANSVSTTIRDLCSIVCFSLSSGGSVLLGKEIGENRLKEAKSDGARLCHVTLLIGAITGIVLILIRPLVFMFFDLSDRAYEYLNIMMYINAYYVIGQAINTLTIAGIFRAGGDSKFGLFCDIIVMWFISVPFGLISAFVFKWPPMVVYFILCLDEIWKLPIVYKRYKSYKWLKNITRD